MYLHAYPESYPYTPYPGAYLEPVTPRPAPSTAMANNQEPFSTPGIMAPSPALVVSAPAQDSAVPAVLDLLNRAWTDFSVAPRDYDNYLAFMQTAAPDLYDQFAGLDYAGNYARHNDPAVGGSAPGTLPSAPAKKGANVGILAALAAGAYFLFGRK